ncbi:alpha-N-acetylgalactosaminidase isoform X5 [Pteropus medius]|uniref:alpha-N-acetylgalactosaminidase isoform X5 n=1 Tax=Pteropus vampyrus TaxID=132908 RepID=UPI00196B5E54|nr:alpha-N-acetylgalactosaminidase isoform X5 [Pteropus giganteus]
MRERSSVLEWRRGGSSEVITDVCWRSGLTSVRDPPPGAGRGSGEWVCPSSPAACLVRALPTIPPKGARFGPHTRRVACAPRLSGFFFVGESVGWGAGPTGQRPRVGPETGVSYQELPGAGRLSRFRGPRTGAVLPRRREPRPRGAAASRSPLGPLSPPRRPARRSPWVVARGPGFGRSPGRSCLRTPRFRQAGSMAAGAGRPRARGDPARAARVAAPTPPGPGLTRPGSVKMALGPRGRETEAGEAGTRLSYGAGQWRAASNPGSHLKPSARLVLSHPPLPAMETPSPAPPLQAPSPRPAHSSRRAKPQSASPGRLLWAGSYSALKARRSFLATQLGPRSDQISASGVTHFCLCHSRWPAIHPQPPGPACVQSKVDCRQAPPLWNAVGESRDWSGRRLWRQRRRLV